MNAVCGVCWIQGRTDIAPGVWDAAPELAPPPVSRLERVGKSGGGACLAKIWVLRLRQGDFSSPFLVHQEGRNGRKHFPISFFE